MKIIRKSRKIKSRYIGSVSDLISTGDVYGISPALVCLKYIVELNGKKAPYYCNPPKVYSDEVPLPTYLFFTNRSAYFLEKECIEIAGLWHKISLNNLKFI